MGSKFLPMAVTSPPINGYRGMQARLLVVLKKDQPLPVKDIAARFGVTPNALRRHLKSLELDGVVRYRREVRGVGGPVFAYSLTERGEALFPTAYGSALADVLEAVREEHGVEGVIRIFRRHWESVAGRVPSSGEGASLGERASDLAALLSAEGYMAEAETQSETEATIREHNCAVREVALRFPEICAAEAEFLESTLGASVDRHAHILSGCNACEYTVRIGAATRQAGKTVAGRTDMHE